MLLFKGCVCMLLKVFHSHCTDNLLADVMLWLCIRSPGYCSQVVPYAYLGILRSPFTKCYKDSNFKKFIMAFWDVLFEDEQNIFQFQVMTGLLLSVLLHGGCPRHAVIVLVSLR